MFNAPKESPAYTSMVIAWSLTEVARYTYYVVNLCKKTSPMLTWLRYVAIRALRGTGVLIKA